MVDQNATLKTTGNNYEQKQNRQPSDNLPKRKAFLCMVQMKTLLKKQM